MANSYLLEVITPDRLFYMGEVEQVIVRTQKGDEGFMASHTWACKLLATGELWIKEKDDPEYKIAALSGGFVDVRDSITIYADSAEWPDEVDEERAKLSKERAQQRLDTRQTEDVIDYERAKLAVVKANTRLNIKVGSGRRRK